MVYEGVATLLVGRPALWPLFFFIIERAAKRIMPKNTYTHKIDFNPSWLLCK